MVRFLEEQLVSIEGSTKVSFHSLSFDRHAENIGDAMQKGNVTLGEFTFRSAV
jgi:hypothetical protein